MATGSSGSCSTLLKLSQPTQVAGRTRLVCWNDMVTVRTIGYQEKAPNTNNMGSRKISVVSPPPATQLAGVRRGRFSPAAPLRWRGVIGTDGDGAVVGDPSRSSPT